MVVVGDGALRAELEARAERLGVADTVTFLGHRDDVEWVFGGVDLALITSDTECMPGVSIEALMAGCPMVTVPVVGVDRVVDHGVTGLVVDGFDGHGHGRRRGTVAGRRRGPSGHEPRVPGAQPSGSRPGPRPRSTPNGSPPLWTGVDRGSGAPPACLTPRQLFQHAVANR